MQLEAASLTMPKAAALYDAGEPCGIETNDTKYAPPRRRMRPARPPYLGGIGYAAEYHVERYWRESYIPRIAPHMILKFIAEKALDLPRSWDPIHHRNRRNPPENDSKPSRP
jgi:acyl-CoA dehydrogenase